MVLRCGWKAWGMRRKSSLGAKMNLQKWFGETSTWKWLTFGGIQLALLEALPSLGSFEQQPFVPTLELALPMISLTTE
jgi:hypothetical protein